MSLGKLRVFLLLTAGMVLSACQSADEGLTYLPDSTAAGNPHPASYGADSMMFRKPIPSRPDWKPMPFYFKECSEIGQNSYYSKTSYNCSGF